MTDQTLKLADVVEFVRGVTFDKSQQESVANGTNVPLLRAGNIQASLEIKSDLIFVPRAIVRNEQILKPGDVAICLSSGSPYLVGKTAALDQEWYGTVGGFCGIIRPKYIEPEFLALWLRGPSFITWRDEQARGANIQNLRFSELGSLEINLPGRDKQRQIAAKLKSQLAEVETARQALALQSRDIKELVLRLKTQIFQKLEQAERIPLGDVLLNIEAGKSFQTLETLPKNNEMGVLKVSAVSWGAFKPDEAKAIDENYVPNDRHRIYKGDLIISRANTIDLVGAVVKAEKDYPNRLLSDKTLRLVFDEQRVEADYLLYALRWPEARAFIEANATGTSDSMRNISQKTINQIPIPIVDKNIQKVIIEFERSIEKQIIQIEKVHEISNTDLDVLPTKLLAQAFNS